MFNKFKYVNSRHFSQYKNNQLTYRYAKRMIKSSITDRSRLIWKVRHQGVSFGRHKKLSKENQPILPFSELFRACIPSLCLFDNHDLSTEGAKSMYNPRVQKNFQSHFELKTLLSETGDHNRFDFYNYFENVT